MIKLFYGSEKTNSYRPEPWNWTTNPFPAFRGAGQRYNAFLAVANGFTPWFSSFDLADNTAMSDDYCKVIMTKKGTRLLVPCGKNDDERILLVTARGGFRGGFGVIEGVGAEILWENHMSMHCAPVAHIVARVTDPEGYVRTETGRRSCSGYTEVYSWKGGYFGMDTEEYDAAVETGTLFAAHDTIQSDLEKCKAKRAEQAASRTARVGFIARLEAVNARIEKAGVGMSTYELGGDTFFIERGRGGSTIRRLYIKEEVAKAEAKAEKAEADRIMRDAVTNWKPQFKAATEGYTFTKDKDPWGDQQPQYYANRVTVWSVAKRKFVRYEYSAEGLAQFKTDIPSYEEEYQIKLRAKAEDEAKAKAEEAERLAEQERCARNAERVNCLLAGTELPKELWSIFEGSEDMDSDILKDVEAILAARSAEKDDMDLHELCNCGLDRRCNAIHRVLARTGGGHAELRISSQAGSRALARFIAGKNF